MVHLDTNTLIRFFTKDDIHKAQKVRALLKKEATIFIADVVFPELEYILDNTYSFTREKIVEVYKIILSQENITVSKEVRNAIWIFETTKLDMADCIIASSSEKESLASFDKELLKLESVSPYWKD